jgi:HTH-type transcriptional regulator / antitoxin HigA
MSSCKPHQRWVSVKSIFRLLIELLHLKECDARSVPLLRFFHHTYRAIQQDEHEYKSHELQVMTAVAFNPKTLAPAWAACQRVLPVRLAAIHTQVDYERAVEFMNHLLDMVSDDEEHVLPGMLELLGQLIEDYESQHYALPGAEPAQVLRFLLELHDLKQADLAAELDSQSVVSEILNGRRQINARQAKALVKRFGVSAAVFI